MEIRFAQARDVGDILRLLRQVGRVHHEGRGDIFRSDAQKYGASQVLSMLDVPDAPIFVAVEDGRLLGYGFCFVRKIEKDPVLCDRTELYIDDLCVDEDCRGKGVGKAIYEQILRYAKQRGCYHVTLNVWSCNPGAVAFYEAMGMSPMKIGMEALL